MGRYIISELSSFSVKSNLQVITPSNAIANHTRKILDSSLKISHYSLESLTQNIVRRRGLGIASTLLSRRLLQNAVREIMPSKDVVGTAKAFLPTIKDLFRSGVDLQRLEQYIDPRVQQLSKVAIAYQAQLRNKKRIDAAQLYWQGSIDIAYQKSYLFYGYFAPTRDELAIINAIAGQDSILVMPKSDFYPQNQQGIEWLEDRGWELSEVDTPKLSVETGMGSWGDRGETTIGRKLQGCFARREDLPAGVGLNVYSNLEAEVRGVLTQVKTLLTQGVKNQDIVLIANDEKLYGETLIDIAWEYSLPLRVAYEIPLEQTRMGAWLKLLLEVIRDNFPFEATAKLLSHPLAQFMSDEIWAIARQEHPQGLSAWQGLGIDLSCLVNFEHSSYSRQVWLQQIQNVLTDWDVLEKGKLWAREIVAYYRLQEALSELSNSPQQILSKSAFIREINEILALLTVPAQPGIGGIELHSPAALLGTNYPYVFVLGSGEGILPMAIADDAILDFYSRQQLDKQGFEIETAIDLARRETFNFYCLLGIPLQQIIFSYPESIDRTAILPSPYLASLGLQPTPLNTLPLASVELSRQAYLRRSELLDSQTSTALLLPKIISAWQVEASRESAIAPNEYDGVIGIAIAPTSKIFSASQLTQLGQCPFKWFSARLLKLKELPEADSDLDAAVRGNLYHRCLELSLSQIKTASDLAKFNQEQLAQAFATAEKELNLARLPGWDIQRQEHLDLLALNLATAEFLPTDREVVAAETKFNTQWYGLQIQGQVDRIDRTNAGLAITDYKTSGVIPAGVKDATGKANIDIQLAVYQDAIAEQYPSENIDTTAYYSLTKQKTISRPRKDPAELAEFAQRVQTHLAEGSYPVAPDIDRQACRYCDYDAVCRRGDRLSRKPRTSPTSP